MGGIDPITGLPEEIGAFMEIAKESQAIRVSTEKKKFGKVNTVVEGISSRELNVKDIARKLKEKFACGGTCKDNMIELQGNHTGRIKEVLITLGFPPENIQFRR